MSWKQYKTAHLYDPYQVAPLVVVCVVAVVVVLAVIVDVVAGMVDGVVVAVDGVVVFVGVVAGVRVVAVGLRFEISALVAGGEQSEHLCECQIL
jgi:hypothetical protein